MKNIIRFSFAATALVLAGSAFSANQIHLTTESAKGGTMLAMDVVGDGNASGFQFTVKVPGLVASDKAAGAGCVAQLPKSYLSSCKIVDGEVRVAALDSTSKALPTTLMSVGTVFLRGVRLDAGKAGNQVSLANVEFADGQGNALPFEGNVDAAKAKAEAAVH
ncbi:MAG: hypothetical protein IPK97_00365 [Ahniella sp.]|nr:hypothetical protein [Ahniella sp.]